MLNKALLASPKEFRISIGTQTHCSVQLSKTSAMPGDKITVTVNPATGYGNTTVGISTNGSVTKVNNTTFTFIMPFTDVVVNASASILSFRINVNKQGSGNVNVKSVANYGETVTVTCSPANKFIFKSISSEDVSFSGSGNSRTFKMPNKDITISVIFFQNVFTFTHKEQYEDDKPSSHLYLSPNPGPAWEYEGVTYYIDMVKYWYFYGSNASPCVYPELYRLDGASRKDAMPFTLKVTCLTSNQSYTFPKNHYYDPPQGSIGIAYKNNDFSFEPQPTKIITHP